MKREDLYRITNTTQHLDFDNYLKEIVFDKERREEFYRKLLAIDPQSVTTDTFRDYFEEYAAERKSKQQVYTPDSVATIMSRLVGLEPTKEYTAYDPTAGSGTLLIKKWWADIQAKTPWTYHVNEHFYRADELGDNVIHYLLHNLAMRGMNVIVCHGDSLERQYKQIYLIQNSKNDFLAFSDINVMPHSEEVTEEFGVTKWLEDPIDHIETRLEDMFRVVK